MTVKLPSTLLRFQVLYICKSEPSYGYEVVSKIEEFSGGHWSPSYGTIYPLIERLKEERLLKELDDSEVRERDLDGDDRNYFVITEKGAKELENVIESKEEHEEDFRELILGHLNLYAKTYGAENLENLLEQVDESESIKKSCKDTA